MTFDDSLEFADIDFRKQAEIYPIGKGTTTETLPE
jgi:hypothetical protein